MLLPVPLPAVVLAKVLAHWAVTGLPDYLPAGGAAAGDGRVRLENHGADAAARHAGAGSFSPRRASGDRPAGAAASCWAFWCCR